MKHTIVKSSNVWDKNERSTSNASLIRTSSLKEVQDRIINSFPQTTKKFR